MSRWRVARHYGFGAARIPIQPEPHRVERPGLRDAVAALAEELTEGGSRASLRRIAGETPAILLGLLLLTAFIVTMARDHTDRSEIQVVMFDSAPPVEPLVPEPEPEVLPEPEPEPIVERPRPVEPPPPQLARKPEPPPPPPEAPRTRPRPKPPAPVVPRIAEVEPPPRPAPRPERAVRERPQPVAPRPRVEIDALAARPTPTAAPTHTRVAHQPTPTSARPVPQLQAPTAPAPDLPQESPTQRTFRVAAATPTASTKAPRLPGIAPAPVEPTPAPTAAPRARPTRASVRAPVPLAPRRPRSQVRPCRRRWPMRRPRPRRRPTRQAPAPPSPSARRAPLPSAAPVRAPTAPSRAVPALATRTGREAPVVETGSHEDRPGLAGVPLGDLAACVTDREEDRLKQAVVAAVKAQGECVSSKGTYRFVETKNLNAFLMWIERAPSRGVEDRCTELRYALECLESAGRRAAR
ncbi:MAG: hypothetical protein H6748_20640 [Spirochaetaceae bacterium]|nr:hypothetical protein [Spirochaetaceae bacterium]